MGQKNKEKNFVSCVVYLHNDGEVVGEFLGSICGVMQENFEKYEIVCVNDGCTDDTVEQVHAFLEKQSDLKAVSLINLSFYQGVETAMNAGSDLVVGDFLFEFDRCCPDFDPELVMQVYRRALEGYDVVSAAPKKGVALSSKIFYALYNWSSHFRYRIRQERFRIVSRRAVNRVNQMNVYVPYRKAMYMNCGLKAEHVYYDELSVEHAVDHRKEHSGRVELAMDAFIYYTNLMEYIALGITILFFLITLGILAFVFWSFFWDQSLVSGWVSMMGFLSMAFIGIFGLLAIGLKYLSVLVDLLYRQSHYTIENVEKL